MREVFCAVRSLWVAATPEEVVRQSWLRKMVSDLGYPSQLLVVEKNLGELPHLQGRQTPDRRLDILCYLKEDEKLTPLILLECKDEKLSQKALEQVLGYNHYVGAPFVGVINLTQGLVQGGEAHWSSLPLYEELLACKTQM